MATRRAGPGAPPSLLPLEIFIYLFGGGAGRAREEETSQTREENPTPAGLGPPGRLPARGPAAGRPRLPSGGVLGADWCPPGALGWRIPQSSASTVPRCVPGANPSRPRGRLPSGPGPPARQSAGPSVHARPSHLPPETGDAGRGRECETSQGGGLRAGGAGKGCQGWAQGKGWRAQEVLELPPRTRFPSLGGGRGGLPCQQYKGTQN